MSVGLKTHLEDAQKMKEQEQADYVQKIVRWFYNCGSILQLRQIVLLTYILTYTIYLELLYVLHLCSLLFVVLFPVSFLKFKSW